MRITELCAWGAVAPDTPWERLEAVLREKTLGWAGEGATLKQAIQEGGKTRAAAEARLSDLKVKKVPPLSPAWKLAEAECKKWALRFEVAGLLVEAERFREVRARLDQLISEGKRNLAKLALADLRAVGDKHPEILGRAWQEAEATFLDAFGQATPASTPPPTPAPPPAPVADVTDYASRITPHASCSTDQLPPSSHPAPAAEDIQERMRVGETVMELRPKLRVFGRYRLEKAIGRGGMGVVWLARDERLDRPVALKFLPEIVRLDPGAVKELTRETQRSLDLTHPHIVRINDYVEDSELAAISMEYVDGPTLTALRAAKASDVFEVEELRGWVRQLGEALDYAHTRARVVHRDLKPANLMVNAAGELKVADFGISRSLSESFSRASMGTGGTPMYMSPQQALGEKPSVADDVYGVGATLYELLTGKPPFYSGDIGMQLKEKVPPLASERRKDLGVKGAPIPAEWDRAIAACLEKDPGKRPSSVREMIEMLDRREMPAVPAMDGILEPKPELVPGPATQASQAKRRVLCAAGLVGLLAVVLWFVYRPSQPHRNGRGGLMVKTEPAGAAVVLGSEHTEKSPVTFAGVPVGKHFLKIALEGYEPAAREIEVTENQTNDLGMIALVRSVGALQVESQPPGMNFEVTGAAGALDTRRGSTPGEVPGLPTGEYRVVLKRPGWADIEKRIEVRRNETVRVAGEFPEGDLEVSSDPAGADVELDGKALGKAPVKVKAPAGQHRLAGRYKEWKPQVLAVSVGKGEKKQVAISFEYGSVLVTSEPSGGVVKEGSRELGSTPLRLAEIEPGEVSYHVEMAGRLAKEARGKVAAGQTLQLNVKLERPPPQLGEVASLDLGRGIDGRKELAGPELWFRGQGRASGGVRELERRGCLLPVGVREGGGNAGGGPDLPVAHRGGVGVCLPRRASRNEVLVGRQPGGRSWTFEHRQQRRVGKRARELGFEGIVERRVRVGGAWTAGMRKARTKSVTRQASVVGCCGEARSVTSQAACGARPASGVGQGSQSAPPAFACL